MLHAAKKPVLTCWRKPHHARGPAKYRTPQDFAPLVDWEVPSCVVAARTADKKWVLVGRWHATRRTFHWEFPAGPMLCGERPESAAGFELARTTGLRASSWRVLQDDALLRDAQDLSCVVVLADGVEPHPDADREDPFVPVRLVTDAEMDRLVQDGMIRDTATIEAWTSLFDHTEPRLSV